MPQPDTTTAYRYPTERLILALTFLMVGLVIALTATATLCASVGFIAIVVALSYFSSRSRHQSLLKGARKVTPKSTPELAKLVNVGAERLGPGNVEVFVASSRKMNAYTFGLSDPKVVVLYSELFKVMDAQELLFILGHEMGHVRLGHTWLNSLVGGMAGIPSAAAVSALLMFTFLGWNRACEYSADRAGLLACGSPEKAISALIKLVAGHQARTKAGMELAYRQIDAQDDTIMGDISEALSSHPLLIRRINNLRKYARSAQYRRLK